MQGVDFNGVRWVKAWKQAGIPAGFETLLQALNVPEVGDVPLILRGNLDEQPSGSTDLVLFLANLKTGNLTKHPAFPIFLANLVQKIRQTQLPESTYTGEAIPLPSPAEYHTIRLSAPQATPVSFNTTWPAVWDQTLAPGLYSFELERLDGKLRKETVAVNAGSARESDIRPQSWTGGVSTLSTVGKTGAGPQAEAQQVDLLPWLLGLAILLLFVEASLAWR
jgi:hypothetical protein